MISINFDTNVLMAQRNVNIASNLVNEALQRLTTGFRINSAADDPAGYYFASDLNTELRALSVAQQNIADGVIFMTTAQDSLFNMGDIINRLKDLALQGSNSTLDSSQRTAIQKETDALLEELFKLKNESTFNDINVFGADKASNHALAVVSGVTPPPIHPKPAPQANLHQITLFKARLTLKKLLQKCRAIKADFPKTSLCSAEALK